MSPSRTHPTGLDRIIGIFSFSFFIFQRVFSQELSFPMATAGLLTCILKLMASGLPEKMSVTMVLAAIRRLQQRDCPGFSPDSLLITTHKPCLRRQEVAANQLRLQRYNKKMNKKITLSAFFISAVIKLSFYSLSFLFF